MFWGKVGPVSQGPLRGFGIPENGRSQVKRHEVMARIVFYNVGIMKNVYYLDYKHIGPHFLF